VSNSRTVSLVTLGCARNEVDSEELAARLAAGGWTLRGEGEDADVVLVNTCGFIEAAKTESIEAVYKAGSSGAKVAAVGCLAERYGSDLAASFDEVDDEEDEDDHVDVQVLGFDDYADIAARLEDVLGGRKRPTART
jgi:ribosomal protein S12 methylthiotransferase